VLPHDRIKRLYETISHFETLGDVREMSSLIDMTQIVGKKTAAG
jgi:hypothetical protein